MLRLTQLAMGRPVSKCSFLPIVHTLSTAAGARCNKVPPLGILNRGGNHMIAEFQDLSLRRAWYRL